MNKFVLTILAIVPLFAFAQVSASLKQKRLDSLHSQFQKDSIEIFGFKKIRPYINYHERNSIGNSKTINFFGPQAGVLLYERHIAGVGLYFSTHNTKKAFSSFDGINPAIKRINIKYLTAFYQYILFQYRYVELHLPIEIGRGILNSNFYDPDGNYYRNSKTNFTIAAAGGQLILKPMRWLGLSAICGYRIADEKIINGFYYAFGVWIGFKPLLIQINYYKTEKKYNKNIIKITQG